MIKIRRFSLSDLRQVMEIDKISFPKRKAWSRDYFKKLYREYPEGFIVAKSEDKIVGYAIGQPKKEKLGEIISLAVAPDWRKKGIGTKLINSLIDHFKKKGLKEIFLHIRVKNKVGFSFYQNLGFKILKTIKNYYRNGDNAYLMIKNLNG